LSTQEIDVYVWHYTLTHSGKSKGKVDHAPPGRRWGAQLPLINPMNPIWLNSFTVKSRSARTDTSEQRSDFKDRFI